MGKKYSCITVDEKTMDQLEAAKDHFNLKTIPETIRLLLLIDEWSLAIKCRLSKDKE